MPSRHRRFPPPAAILQRAVRQQSLRVARAASCARRFAGAAPMPLPTPARKPAQTLRAIRRRNLPRPPSSPRVRHVPASPRRAAASRASRLQQPYPGSPPRRARWQPPVPGAKAASVAARAMRSSPTRTPSWRFRISSARRHCHSGSTNTSRATCSSPSCTRCWPKPVSVPVVKWKN